MLQEKMVVNECYILQYCIGKDTYTENWVATAIFSATNFLLRFIDEDIRSDELINQLRLEALKTYNIHGPLIKDFIEIERFENRVFLSSEYQGEKTLLEIHNSNARHTLTQACAYLFALAHGLSLFHEHGQIYGCLTAENILTSRTHADSLLLKIRKPGMLALLPVTKNTHRNILENYAYLSPEHKQNIALYPGSDLYALGIHFVRLITARLPYADTIEAVQAGNAALRFVSKALFRRGVPEQMIRIVIKLLIPDTGIRYATCEALISDLEIFFSSTENRALYLLESHSGSESEDAKLRSFQNSVYFNSLSADNAHPQPSIKTMYPVEKVYQSDGQETPEGKDLVIAESEAGWSVEDYIAYAKGEVPNIAIQFTPKPEPVPPYPAQKETMRAEKSNISVELSPVTVHKKTAAQSHILPSQSLTQNIPAIQMLTETKPATENPHTPEVVANAPKPLKSIAKPPAASPRQWAYHPIQAQDILKIIERSAYQARKGRGSFRFIQEPLNGYTEPNFITHKENENNHYLFLNAGSFARYGLAEVQNFSEMLEKSITGVLASEPIGKRRYLQGKINQVRRDFKGEGSPQEILCRIRLLGSKKRPLILILRGGERITQPLHDLLCQISEMARETPLCVIVFFEHGHFPKWHTLAQLATVSQLTQRP